MVDVSVLVVSTWARTVGDCLEHGNAVSWINSSAVSVETGFLGAETWARFLLAPQALLKNI